MSFARKQVRLAKPSFFSASWLTWRPSGPSFVILLLGALLFCQANVRAQQADPPSSYDQLVVNANNLLKQGKLDEAKQTAQQAIQNEASRYEGYVLVAKIASQQGQADQASQFAQKALQFAPADRKAQVQQLVDLLAPPKTAAVPPLAPDQQVAIIKTTEGDMVIAFWHDTAPKTVENFQKLAKSGFYDGTAFHRVIKGFMIQGGDPNTKNPADEAHWGQGGPGYTIAPEFNDHPHVRGVISMARTSDPNSAGSQFFICHGSAAFLDHKYTVFGKLIKGDDVLETIATTPTHPPDRPDKRIGVISVKIVPATSVPE